MASGLNLMQEIQDQFLVCKICFEPYRRPKTLSCLHTFCADCLEKHQEAEMERSYRYLLYSRALSCPICRKKTELPSGGVRRLPDNFLVENLTDTLSRRTNASKSPLCEICKPTNNTQAANAAVSKCLDCAKLLCKPCVELHRKTKVTAGHSLFDIEVEKDISCKVHQDEFVRFYCQPCEVCICILCTFQEHKGHEVTSFSEGIEKNCDSLFPLMESCRKRIGTVKDQLELIHKCERGMKKTEELIHDTAITTISAIRKTEKKMIAELFETYGMETMEFIRQKVDLQEDLENLQTTYNLTDIILKDKSIELLLLKNEIENKVKDLLQHEIMCPPTNVVRDVQFVPGQMMFGQLTDNGPRDENANDEEYHQPCKRLCMDTADCQIQTDCIMTAEKETSMGKLPRDDSNEKHIQTDNIVNSEKSTGTDVRDYKPASTKCTMTPPAQRKTRQTMTSGTPTMKRKIQTQAIISEDKVTETIPPDTIDKMTNTILVNHCEVSTLTKRHQVTEQATDTFGLITLVDADMLTSPELHMSSSFTETEPPLMFNKSTCINNPEVAHKLINTSKIGQVNQCTNTPFVAMLDMGTTVKIPGEDKALMTKAIVQLDKGVGFTNIRTCEQGTTTPWQNTVTADKEIMHLPETCDTGIATELKLFKDSSTLTSPLYTDRRAETLQTIPQSVKTRNISVNTIRLTAQQSADLGKIETADKAVSVRLLTKRTRNEEAQTNLTFNTDLLSKCKFPKNVSTNTDQSLRVETKESAVETEAMDCVSRGVATDKVKQKSRAITTKLFENTDSACGPEEVTVVDTGCDAFWPPGLSIIDENAKPAPIDQCTSTEAAVMPAPEMPQMLEKATYMAQTVLVTTGTSTPQVMQGEKKVGTVEVELMDIGVSTTVHKTKDQESYTENTLAGISGTEPTSPQYVDASKNAVQTSDTGTMPSQPYTTDASTTTQVTQLSDQETNTRTVCLHDSSTLTDSVKKMHVAITVRPQTCTVGILKRPHSVTRGTIARPRGQDQGTTMPQIFTRDKEVHVAPHTHDVSTFGRPYLLSSRGIGTEPPPERRAFGTSMPPILQTERAASPMPAQCTERASSPIPPDTQEKEVSACAYMSERASSPLRNMTAEKGTSLPKPETIEHGCHPLLELNPHTKNKGMETERVQTSDRENSPIRLGMRDKQSCTDAVRTVEQALNPIPIPSKDQNISVTPETSCKSVATSVSTAEKSTHISKVRVFDKNEGTPVVTLVEKEMTTVKVQMMNKNMSTENTATIDKQTNTLDVSATYRDAIHNRAKTISRGMTTIPKYFTTRDTSPVRSLSNERATSPIKQGMVDKAVSVTKGELMEPMDKFQKAQMKPNSTDQDNFRPNLASIREDSKESSSGSDEEVFVDASTSASCEDVFQQSGSEKVIHKETLWSQQSQLIKLKDTVSTFSTFGNIPSTILMKIETGTNTAEVNLHNKETSTPPIEMEDKAVVTESFAMQGKMAECITKLKTVRQRLEGPTTVQTCPVVSTAAVVETNVSVSKEHTTSSKEVEDFKKEIRSRPRLDPALLIGAQPSLLQGRSKSLGDKLDDPDMGLAMPPLLRRRNITGETMPSMLTVPKSPPRPRLARKKRLDITQLLSSESLPETESPPLAAISSMPKPQVQTLHSHSIPKLSVETPEAVRMRRRRNKSMGSVEEVRQGVPEAEAEEEEKH